MAENVIAARAENRPLMLEKGMYDSWKTRIWLYIRGKENGEMLIDSIKKGPFNLAEEIIIPSVNGAPDEKRAHTMEDLSLRERIRYDCDIKATNILLLELPIDIYTLINYFETAKEIWDRVKELMEGTELTLQEHEPKLYDEFDRFTSEPGESIHSYYWRYAKLINDMNIIKMTMLKIQINTKFVNHLQLKYSRFVTTAKQAKDLHTVNFDQFYSPSQQSYEPLVIPQQQTALPTQPDSGFVVPSFLPTNDPIASLKKAM
ncbi:hypothetical protein Tco_0856192, partial [Tanacetum coccineum]